MSAEGQMMSDEAGDRLNECLDVLIKVHATFAKETNGSTGAIFDALRLYMVAAAAYLARSGMESSDEDIREILRGLLELGIDDYQFNERLYFGSKAGS